MKLCEFEVNTLEQLDITLSSRTDVPRPYSVAVEALLFDEAGQWILMERGPGCRDEIGKLEGIGGRVENDADFRSALRREIVEEVGQDAQIEILSFFEIRKDTVDVPNSTKKEKKHWVILSYICYLRSGELTIQEPAKNKGFRRLNLQDVDPQKLSSSAASALSSLTDSQGEIKLLIQKARLAG